MPILHTLSDAKPGAPSAATEARGLAATAWALARTARPHSLVWFVALPTWTIALFLHGTALSFADVALLTLAFVLTDAGLTTWNDLTDLDTDRESSEAQRNTRPLAAGTIPPHWALAQTAILETAGVVAGFVVSWSFGLLLAAGVVYGILYSARPVRIGGRPLWSQAFWVVLWPAIYFGCWLALGGDAQRGLLYVLSTVLFMGIGETLAKDLRDLDNDALTGKRTTPVALGPQRASDLSRLAFVAGSISYVAAACLVEPLNPALVLATTVAVGVWCVKASLLTREIRLQYSKEAAKSLHEGAIGAFTTVNLIFVVGLYQ